MAELLVLRGYNEGYKYESLKHFYMKFYDINDGLVRWGVVCRIKGEMWERGTYKVKYKCVNLLKKLQKINVQLQ